MARNGLARRVIQAFFDAYRRVPVRWRLGGGSAALTFVILAGVAGVTEVLTDRQLSNCVPTQQTAGALGRLTGELERSVRSDRQRRQLWSRRSG